MTADAIDRILADFRTWLECLPDGSEPLPAAPPAVDLATLAAQFTALRHDVNLQTKATRAVLDLHGSAKAPAPDSDASLKPTRKLLIDLADALSLSLREVTRTIEALAEAEEVEPEPWPEMPAASASPSFFSRILGRGSPSAESLAWAEAMEARAAELTERQAAEREQLASVLAGLADGYTLSLRRVERAFPQYDLEPIECEGEPFDPELMEVVEVVGDADAPSGTVVAVVRDGYRVAGQVLRFAQVTVAR